MPGWLKVTAAAKYYGVSVRTFRTLLTQGFPHIRLPTGTLLIERTAGDEWLRGLNVDNGDERIIDELLGR